MKNICYVQGDATRPQGEGSKIIAHVCNDIGRWGKGFVLALSRRSPEPERAFLRWFAGREENDYALGSVQFVQLEIDLCVANMIGQHKVRLEDDEGPAPVRYHAIEQALAKVGEKALELQASVHMPRIGCGLAGGEWEKIEPLIIKNLSQRDVEVFVYDLA